MKIYRSIYPFGEQREGNDCLQAVVSEAVPIGADTVTIHYASGGSVTSNALAQDIEYRTIQISRILDADGSEITTTAWINDLIYLEGSNFSTTLANNAITFTGESSQVTIYPLAWGNTCNPSYQCLQAKISNLVPTGNDTVSVHYVLGGPDPSNTVELNITGVFYYHNNQVGTPVAITDSERNVVWRAEYFPFGDVVDATVQTVGNHLNRRKLTGHYQDDELVLDNEGDENDASLVYMKARYYDTQIGRFYSPDPIGATGEKGSANQDYAYSYVGNNPILRLDPSGLWYIEANIGVPIPLFGPSFGVALDFPEGEKYKVYGYGGLGVFTPGLSGSITISLNDVAKWNAGLQGQFIGAAQVGVDAEAFADWYDRKIPWGESGPTVSKELKDLIDTGFYEFGAGGSVPFDIGVSLTGFRTFLIYDENFPEDDRWGYEDSWEELEKELEP